MIADIFTKGSFTKPTWDALLDLAQITALPEPLDKKQQEEQILKQRLQNIPTPMGRRARRPALGNQSQADNPPALGNKSQVGARPAEAMAPAAVAEATTTTTTTTTATLAADHPRQPLQLIDSAFSPKALCKEW